MEGDLFGTVTSQQHLKTSKGLLGYAVDTIVSHDDDGNPMEAEKIARSPRVAQIPVPREEFENTAI
jgi:hypothetical protein